MPCDPCTPAETMASESQQSNWSVTECFGAMATDEDTSPKLRRKRSIGSAMKTDDPVPEETEVVDPEEAKMLEEFKTLVIKMNESIKPFQFNMVALAGKKSGGAIFVPQETIFVFNGNDIDQLNAVRMALVKKAREWKEKNPGVTNAFQLIESFGMSNVNITAVGGIDFGCSRIPTKSAKDKTSTASANKKAVKKGAKKQKKA